MESGIFVRDYSSVFSKNSGLVRNLTGVVHGRNGMEILLLDTDYKREGSDYTGNAVIRLFGRVKGSRQRITVQVRDYYPYFYVHLPKEKLANIEENLTKVRNIYKNLQEK